MQLVDFKDCEMVTQPKEQNILFYVVEGSCAVISEERIKKKITVHVRRTRKKRAKAIEDGTLENPDDKSQGAVFESDFPYDILTKGDYKKIIEGQTFGNNKILTSKSWRPSFVLGIGEQIKIICIPVTVIE